MAVQRQETVAFDRPGGETCPARAGRPIDFEQLERQTFGDRALEQEVLAMFMQQATLAVDSLASADPATSQRLAHTLKGSSRSVGAVRLAALCERLEASPGDRKLVHGLARELGAIRDQIASISR